MVFSSHIFLLYFLPIFLIAYFATPKKFRNYTLLLFSLVFYAYGAPDFIFLLVGSCIVNFFLVKWMASADAGRKKKIICAVSIFVSLSLLLYFKYANFFVENINALLGLAHREPIPWMKVALPIGISFFTFQSITYTIDVYRGTASPSKKLTDYVLYIMMFPQLIAGPIVKYNSVAQQLVERKVTTEDFVTGFYRFVIGLAKKSADSQHVGQKRRCHFRHELRRFVVGNGLDWHTFLYLADLFRFFWLFRHGHRFGKDDGIPFPGELQQPVYQPEHQRVLAPLAHDFGRFYERVPLHSAGRQPLLEGKNVSESGHRFPVFRILAWRRLEFRPLGRVSWFLHHHGQDFLARCAEKNRQDSFGDSYVFCRQSGLGVVPCRGFGVAWFLLSGPVCFQGWCNTEL